MFTSELRFVVSEETAAAFLDWARMELTADPYAAERGGDSYQTTTIYFDTEEFDLFFRRGSHGRAKFRIRSYNAGERIFLERKMKAGSRRSKRRSSIALEELGR